jgi:hypothetical protein
MVSMLAYQLFLFCVCRASERSRHSDSKVDEVLILDKRTQYFILFRRTSRVSAKSILTTTRNIKSYVYSKLKPKYNAVWKTEMFNDRPGKQYGNKLRT